MAATQQVMLAWMFRQIITGPAYQFYDDIESYTTGNIILLKSGIHGYVGGSTRIGLTTGYFLFADIYAYDDFEVYSTGNLPALVPVLTGIGFGFNLIGGRIIDSGSF